MNSPLPSLRSLTLCVRLRPRFLHRQDLSVSNTSARCDSTSAAQPPAPLPGLCSGSRCGMRRGGSCVREGETVEGTITFVLLEIYLHSLNKGMVIRFQEGSRITGYAEVLEVYNDLLKC